MSQRKKLTSEELWNSNKRRVGRPHKTTKEEGWLLDRLAGIAVDIYLDLKEVEWDKSHVEGLGTKHKDGIDS